MLTQTTEYALRAVTFLATQAARGKTPTSADKIAEAITTFHVVNAVEPVKRICNSSPNLQSHTSLCPLHAELDHAYEVTEQPFAHVTIAGLLNSINPIIPLVDSP